MTSGGSDRDTLSKLWQMGTVAEYQNEFEILINRLLGIPESLRKSFYISELKPALQCALLRARITEARFEDENNQAVDTNVGDQEDLDMKDKQEVKKADDQEIENIKDEEGKNAEDQQVSKADVDTNNDDFGCSLPSHKRVDLTVEEVVLENIKSDLKKYKDEQGLGIARLMANGCLLRELVMVGVESVTPMLQEDGRPKRPQREKKVNQECFSRQHLEGKVVLRSEE
ncbi:hypothetical protein Tco_1336778 [Tanacetum coccineum]